MRYFGSKIVQQFRSGDFQLIAASLAFSTVLSIVPYIVVILELVRYVGATEKLYPAVESFILQQLAGPAGPQGVNWFRRSLERLHQGGLGGWGLAFLVLTSLSLVRDMETAINRIWGIKQKRKILKRLFFNLLFLLCLPFCSMVFLSLIEAKILPAGASKSSMPGQGFFFVFALLAIVYKWIPARNVGFIPAGIGAFIAAVLLYLEKVLFGAVTIKVFDYGKMYGSLASIPLFLIWILIVWYIILLGASVSASFYKEAS